VGVGCFGSMIRVDAQVLSLFYFRFDVVVFLKIGKNWSQEETLIKQSMYQFYFQDYICLTILVPTQLWKKYHNIFLIFFES